MATSDALTALSLHPALPPELLRDLLALPGVGGDALARRTDLPRTLVDEVLTAPDHRYVIALARNPALSAADRRILAAHPGPWARTALAIHTESLPPDLLTRLLDDPDPQVRRCLAQRADLPAPARARLARDPDPEVRAKLAQWCTEAPEDVRRLLLTDPEPQVRGAACDVYFRRLPHPVPPADLWPALLADPATRAGVVAHLRPLALETAVALAADPDEKVRRAVAAHPELPPDLVEALARDEDPVVRAEVLVRQDAPEALRAEIHAYLTAGAALLRGDDLPAVLSDRDEDALMVAAGCELALVSLEFRIVEWVRDDPLPHVESPFPVFRRSAALGGAALPAGTVARLLDDEDQEVRLAAAESTPVLDAETTERLERRHRHSRKRPLRPADLHPFPPEVLRRFATDPDPRLRELAPRDPLLPPELAAALAADPEDDVRRAVARHPRLPLPPLLALLDDGAAHVAREAGRNTALPAAEVRRIVMEALRIRKPEGRE
ncbi:hypothetical protein [Streptomyces cinereoruber]|uniref:hypothetical protein n=1 Tax=Streptomyces cinereoruber TaxID=67260 RepID=UPI0036287A7E